MRTRAGLVLLGAILAGCNSTISHIQPLGTARYESKPGNCEVVFYKDEKPSGPYEKIGSIESHIKKNIFLGQKVQLEDEAYAELRKKACKMGGDAVIIDDHMESSAGELTHVHVWATVIKQNQ